MNMNSTHAREVAQAEDAHCQSGHPDLTPSSRVEIDGNLVTLRFVANFQSGEGCGREHMSSCLRLQWQCPGSELTPEACQSITAKLEEASVKLTQEAGHRVISSRSTYSPGTDQNAMLAKKDARTVFLQYESAHEAMLALQNFTRQYVQCSFPVSYPKMSNIYVRAPLPSPTSGQKADESDQSTAQLDICPESVEYVATAHDVTGTPLPARPDYIPTTMDQMTWAESSMFQTAPTSLADHRSVDCHEYDEGASRYHTYLDDCKI
ncbi:hypothetical protein G7K_1766-t1 [Saitoella complicata NRRL Y-17804]|uniref:Uncharacterized protein n=1 Tax=Saitoella complicata (strain BCRC 22490 / CBS 7301 / JCM 7358 / NBRC 10748 / NRRL Y-17804) TaxID=698492 RepID=A0A0E9NCG5_SAICN|nr:hypothetical protein G7K_1766-t1 [Saitoella complicata NRRL Y-17804]